MSILVHSFMLTIHHMLLTSPVYSAAQIMSDTDTAPHAPLTDKVTKIE